jgi:GAF domain-containing protein
MFSRLVDRDFIDNLVRLAGQAAQADAASLFTLDPTASFLKPFSVYGLPKAYVDGIGPVALGTQCCGRAVAFKRPWIVEDMMTDPLFADGIKGAKTSDIRAGFSVPVINRGGTAVGSLACHFRRPYRPTEVDIERNQHFAVLIAEALEHVRAEASSWREPFEAALQELDAGRRAGLIEKATSAIYARLEHSHSGGAPADEVALMGALRVLRELGASNPTVV